MSLSRDLSCSALHVGEFLFYSFCCFIAYINIGPVFAILNFLFVSTELKEKKSATEIITNEYRQYPQYKTKINHLLNTIVIDACEKGNNNEFCCGCTPPGVTIRLIDDKTNKEETFFVPMDFFNHLVFDVDFSNGARVKRIRGENLLHSLRKNNVKEFYRCYYRTLAKYNDDCHPGIYSIPFKGDEWEEEYKWRKMFEKEVLPKIKSQ